MEGEEDMPSGFFEKLKARFGKAKAAEEAEIVIKEYSEQDFLSDLKWTEKAYLTTVIAAAVLVAIAIAVAVMWKVSYGLMIAIIIVLGYIGVTGNILYSRLGFSYDSLPGALRIKDVYGKNREQVFIPRRLFWLDVCEIGNKAFCHTSSASIKTVYLPRALKTIGENAFEGCDALCCICFEGSEDEWNAIEKNTSFEGIEILFGQEIAYPEKPKKEKKKKERQDGDREEE